MSRRENADAPFALRAYISRRADCGGRVKIRVFLILVFLSLRRRIRGEKDIRVVGGYFNSVMFVRFAKHSNALCDRVRLYGLNRNGARVGVSQKTAADKFVERLSIFAAYNTGVNRRKPAAAFNIINKRPLNRFGFPRLFLPPTIPE